MKRWSLLLLLLLVPLTMAPRTSVTTDFGYDLHAQVPRSQVQAPAAVPFKLIVDSHSDETVDAELQIIAAIGREKDAVRVLAASGGCVVEGSGAKCLITDLAPHSERAVTLVVQPRVAGELTFGVLEPNVVQALGQFTVEVLPANRPRR